MFGTWGLYHPDTGQAACGPLLSLFGALHRRYSFVTLLNPFSGSVDYNRTRDGGTILIVEGQMFFHVQGRIASSVLWSGKTSLYFLLSLVEG